MTLPANAVRQPFAPAASVDRAPPQNVTPEDERLFAHEYRRELDAAGVFEMRDVRLLSNGMMVHDRRLVLDYYFGFPSSTLLRSKAKARFEGTVLNRRTRATRRETHVLYFTDIASRGFFHWFGDALQKLEALDRWRPELMSLKVFVPYGAPSFMPTTLGAYGLETVVPGRLERLECESVTVLSRVALNGNFRPELMNAMRARLQSHFGSKGAPNRRVYISRQDAPRRRVVNESEIRPILDRHGIEVVSLAGLPYADQVDLVAAAELVVGFHGAGLTHMTLMQPGARVLELRAEGDAHNNCYFALASALDIKYYYLACQGVDSRQGTHSGDFVVNPGRLDAELARLI